jgi:hypothetical protein
MLPSIGVLPDSILLSNLRGSAIVSKEIRQLYLFRVENHQPIPRDYAAEVVDADELVYVVLRGPQGIVITDMLIGIEPQLRQCA